MSEEASKTESDLPEKDQKILSMLTFGERIILERLLELHPSDKAFDLFEMMRNEKPNEEIPTYYFSSPDPYFDRSAGRPCVSLPPCPGAGHPGPSECPPASGSLRSGMLIYDREAEQQSKHRQSPHYSVQGQKEE